jgi:CBS domain containing-hemolysin-like protein
MQWFILAIAITLVVVFVCSMMEAMIFSTTVAEIESLKRSLPRIGGILETMKLKLDETISTILTVNTIATALGSAVIGAIGAHLFTEQILAVVMVSYGAALLVLAEVIPKTLGVVSRKSLQPSLASPLWFMCRTLRPVTYLCNLIVRLVITQPAEKEKSDEEIILLAERGAQQGTLSKSESNIITNALSLDDVRVSEIMTPRTVVTMLKNRATVGEVFREFPNIPFARIPVYGKNVDDVVGLVRRRDLLKAKANDQDFELVEKLMQEISFIPETVTAANALQVFLKSHQQLLVVVDEFGATAGVVTMEDVMEHLLGREIFEKDDVAVDMRELARAKLQKQNRNRRPGDAGTSPTPSGKM